MITDVKKHYYCSQIGSHVLAFDCHTYILPSFILKINIIHIPTTNILEMAKYKAQNNIAFKNEIIYRLSIGTFAFDLDPL